METRHLYRILTGPSFAVFPTCVDVSKAHVPSPSSKFDDEGVAKEIGGEGDAGEEDQQAARVHHRGAARALAPIARLTRQPLTA